MLSLCKHALVFFVLPKLTTRVVNLIVCPLGRRLLTGQLAMMVIGPISWLDTLLNCCCPVRMDAIIVAD